MPHGGDTAREHIHAPSGKVVQVDVACRYCWRVVAEDDDVARVGGEPHGVGLCGAGESLRRQASHAARDRCDLPLLKGIFRRVARPSVQPAGAHKLALQGSDDQLGGDARVTQTQQRPPAVPCPPVQRDERLDNLAARRQQWRHCGSHLWLRELPRQSVDVHHRLDSTEEAVATSSSSPVPVQRVQVEPGGADCERQEEAELRAARHTGRRSST